MDLGQSVLPNDNETLIPFSVKFPTGDFLQTSKSVHPDQVLDLTVLSKPLSGFVQCAALFENFDQKLIWVPTHFLQG